jgi:hypothetical protein
MKLLRRFALLWIFVLAGSFVASAQLKTLNIGRITYIGETPDGTSLFTVNLMNNQLASQITFTSSSHAIVGATGSSGPFTDTIDQFTTPTQVLFASPTPPTPGNCPCWTAAFRAKMSNDPTVTLTLKNGQTITVSSTVDAYLTAPQGQSAIQLQQFAYIILHAVP